MILAKRLAIRQHVLIGRLHGARLPHPDDVRPAAIVTPAGCNRWGAVRTFPDQLIREAIRNELVPRILEPSHAGNL